MDTRKKKQAVGLDGTVWLTVDGQPWSAGERFGLLRAIDAHGSITQAARAVNVCYKTAWDAVKAMNRLAGAPLVSRNCGAHRGSGSGLTPLGRRWVDRFEQIEAAHRHFVQFLGGLAVDLSREFDPAGVMNMKTSARNQLMGTVSGYKAGAVSDEIELQLPGGARIVAIVTRESTERLGLKMGASAFALVKASSVFVATDLGDAHLSARNQLHGTITSVTPGAVNADVVIDVGGGTQIAAVVTQSSLDALSLQPGRPATAFFKASSVIIGTLA